MRNKNLNPWDLPPDVAEAVVDQVASFGQWLWKQPAEYRIAYLGNMLKDVEGRLAGIREEQRSGKLTPEERQASATRYTKLNGYREELVSLIHGERRRAKRRKKARR